MAIKDILTVNKLKRLFNNYERNSERIATVFRGNVDLNNSEIFKYYVVYLERKKVFSTSDYEKLIKKGISSTMLLENSTIERLLIEDISNKINSEFIYSYEVKCILEIFDNDEMIRKVVASKVNDIQALGINVIKTKFMTNEIEELLSLYKKLGFKVEFDVVRDANFLFDEKNQEVLMNKKLLSPETISQMYKYKYEKLKEYAKK